MKTILYITYDGLTDALGQSQVLPYLTRLSQRQIKVIIISFEKQEKFEKNRNEIKALIRNFNIEWIPLSYTKNPPVLSTCIDILKGRRLAFKLYRKYKFDIVHCRGYISAIIGLYLQKKFNVKFIFDMRGWWPDEKVEAGSWDKKIYKPVYHYFKDLERSFFKKADFIVSLTEAGKREIVKQQLALPDKVGVIPTCVDFTIFKPYDEAVRNKMREQLLIPNEAKVLLYSGSLGGNYDINTIFQVFKAFTTRFPDSYLLILSKDVLSEKDQASIKSRKNIRIISAPFTKVSDYLMAGDAALIIYKLAFSVIGRSPTKLGEYWATGLPVISLKGIGDLEALYTKYESGGVLLEYDFSDMDEKMRQLSFPDRNQLRANAKDYYDIQRGVNFYYDVYAALLK